MSWPGFCVRWFQRNNGKSLLLPWFHKRTPQRKQCTSWLKYATTFSNLGGFLLFFLRPLILWFSASFSYFLQLAPSHTIFLVPRRIWTSISVLFQATHSFSAASEKELSLSVGDYVVVRKVTSSRIWPCCCTLSGNTF